MEAYRPRNCGTTPGKEPDDETGGFPEVAYKSLTICRRI
jgi:hypothetical protein